jgi:hypothetical protein
MNKIKIKKTTTKAKQKKKKRKTIEPCRTEPNPPNEDNHLQ